MVLELERQEDEISAQRDDKASAVTPTSETIVAADNGLDGAWDGAVVYTVGHSTRTLEEFIGLLRRYGVATLADVRTMPRSRRNPQFNTDTLSSALEDVGISYVHLPSLGGLRRGLGDASPNTGWRNASFRGYADYMQTAEFAFGLEAVRELSATGSVALMCAEAVPWRCHRSLIADALLVRGVVANDIQSLTRAMPHVLTPFARVDGERINYPKLQPPSPAGSW